MRLRTIGLIVTLVLGLLAGPLPTEAQQAGKVYRIGILSSVSGVRTSPRFKLMTKFDFVINLKTAKQLGITIPPTVLYQATKVIK